MQKHIEENGIRYTLREDGMYYPDLKLPEGTDFEIGRYGRLRAEYLKEHHRVQYMHLLLDGKLNEYLHEVDEECYEMLERLMEQMKAKQGVTEQLKAENMMLWVGMVNNIRASAEEVVLKDIVCVRRRGQSGGAALM